MCGKLGHKKTDYREKHKIPQEERSINKNNPKKKPSTVNAQKSEASDSETSDVENADKTSNAMVLHYGAHSFGWSGVHLRPKANASSHKDTLE